MVSWKSPFFYLGLACLLLTAGCGALLVNEGAKEESLTDGLRNPAELKPKVHVPPDEKVICDFEDGSTNMNPKLYGSSTGAWNAFANGGNNLNNPWVVEGGADGTKMAAHLFGTLVNKGDGVYPSFTLQGRLQKSGTFDASMFKGISFYYKCPADDTVLNRRFNMPIPETLPSSNGGTCSSDCYNHFGAGLAVTGDWTKKSIDFSDLKRQPGWGSPVTPPDFTDHLTELTTIEWQDDSGNTAGNYHVDFWVDQVEFY
jgi:hypothetical protein